MEQQVKKLKVSIKTLGWPMDVGTYDCNTQYRIGVCHWK